MLQSVQPPSLAVWLQRILTPIRENGRNTWCLHHRIFLRVSYLGKWECRYTIIHLILSAIALFCETNLVENCKTLPPKLQKISMFQKGDFIFANTLNSFAPYCTRNPRYATSKSVNTKEIGEGYFKLGCYTHTRCALSFEIFQGYKGIILLAHPCKKLCECRERWCI
jgi:hypothetical protein